MATTDHHLLGGISRHRWVGKRGPGRRPKIQLSATLSGKRWIVAAMRPPGREVRMRIWRTGKRSEPQPCADDIQSVVCGHGRGKSRRRYTDAELERLIKAEGAGGRNMPRPPAFCRPLGASRAIRPGPAAAPANPAE